LLEHPQRAVEEIRRAARPPFVVVHGGGLQITRMLERMNLQSKFIDGLRVTDMRALVAVAGALLGEVQTSLVAELNRNRIAAAGLFGAVRAQQKEGPWGLVGTNLRVSQFPIRALLKAGIVPVVPALALGPDSLLNVNGDETAAAVAASLAAADLIFLTDVEGVKDAGGTVFEHVEEPDELIGAGFVSGGMLPKLRAVKAAMAAGTVRVRVGKTTFGREA
jgi:acetylglutamate kinase